MQHIEEGRRVLLAVLEKRADVGKVERSPSMEGRRMTALVAPKAQAKPQPQPEKWPSELGRRNPGRWAAAAVPTPGLLARLGAYPSGRVDSGGPDC
jgi:hypothetical protein